MMHKQLWYQITALILTKTVTVRVCLSALHISQAPQTQQLDLAKLLPWWVANSFLKDTCRGSVAETITVIASHNPNNGAVSPPAEEDWIPSCHVNICRTSRHMTLLRNWILTQCEWMKQLWGDATQARGAGVWNATYRSALHNSSLLLNTTPVALSRKWILSSAECRGIRNREEL